jgi:hypothetical protein
VHEHLPLIVVEIVMVFGGALAFAWWQLRDLEREKKRREAQRSAQSEKEQPAGNAGGGHAS